MRFDIVFTPEALEDLRLFRKGERTRIIEAIGHKRGGRLFIHGEEYQL